MEHEEERLSLYRDRERLNKELNRLTNEKGGAGGRGAGNALTSANAMQVHSKANFVLCSVYMMHDCLARPSFDVWPLLLLSLGIA